MSEIIDSTPIGNIQLPDYDGLKIATFEGINDQPISPTADSGSNISHVHSEHNKLIDAIISSNTELKKAIQHNFNLVNSADSTAYSALAKANNNEATITNNV